MIVFYCVRLVITDVQVGSTPCSTLEQLPADKTRKITDETSDAQNGDERRPKI